MVWIACEADKFAGTDPDRFLAAVIIAGKHILPKNELLSGE
jgi:hypothetical protein